MNPTDRLPSWIWHPARENKLHTVLSRKFRLDAPIRGVSFRAAFTGATTVSLDGIPYAALPEKPGNVDAFARVSNFPETIGEGEHELIMTIECSAIIPLVEVNGYLWDRRVGAIGYLSADGIWLATDGEWTADGDPAAVVCLLGEEPYGDLEGGPEWFVRGGFGDIGTVALEDASLLGSYGLEGKRLGAGWALKGEFAKDGRIERPEGVELQLFYHLRKQEEWKRMRAEQAALGLSDDGAPNATFDLGKEYNARIKVTNAGQEAARLVWNGAESMEELANYDGCITEAFEALPGETTWTLPQGMRYVRLYALGRPGQAFRLVAAFESAGVTLNKVGFAEADDPLVGRIYDTSAHTSRICHQIGLWDGIKRDRLNWTFDFYLAAKSCYYLWDDHAVLRRAVRELGVGTPYGSWMNGIAEYTLWWLKTVCEYYFHTGDAEFAKEMAEPLERHMKWVEAHIDPEAGGLNPNSYVLIEWVPLSDEEKQSGLQAILALTRSDLRALFLALPELGLDCDWKLRTIPEEAFVGEGLALATTVLGIASGYVSDESARTFLESCELQDPFTPLSAYQLAECFSAFGMHERAYRVIAEVWGGMLDRGATTFWEAYKADTGSQDFHDALTTYTAYDSYRMSLCHAWSSTPVKWISDTLLGVRALEPGFASVRFAPVPVGGLRSCEGAIHTPRGTIRVRWRLDENDRLQATIEAPSSVKVECDEAISAAAE